MGEKVVAYQKHLKTNGRQRSRAIGRCASGAFHFVERMPMDYLLQKLEEGIGKFRRFYLVHYQEDYVRAQLELRRGECNRCGDCCSILFRCPHLDGENNCKIYECHYKQCAAFPIEPRDIKFLRHRCSYYFDGEEPPNLPDGPEARNIAETV